MSIEVVYFETFIESGVRLFALVTTVVGWTLMVRSSAHSNQWDVGLILPPIRKVRCPSGTSGELDLSLHQDNSENNGGAHGVTRRERYDFNE